VTAVQQATAPVVRTIESSPVRTAASPRRAARVTKARAAVAESVETVPTRAAAGAQPAANVAATAAETASNGAATAFEKASESEVPKRVAAAVRDVSRHAANGVRMAPHRAEAAGGAPKRLAAAFDTVARLGSIASAPDSTRPDGEPVRLGSPTGSDGALLPVIATGHALRHAFNGWRHASATREAPTQAVERTGGELAGFAVPAPQPASPSSAAGGIAGAAAMALLGLIAFLVFGSQRPGALVWLRPASAPASPFLALSERPG
jgi:hypothetical protein